MNGRFILLFPPCFLADLDSRSFRVTRVMFLMTFHLISGVDTSWLVTTQRFICFFLVLPPAMPHQSPSASPWTRIPLKLLLWLSISTGVAV